MCPLYMPSSRPKATFASQLHPQFIFLPNASFASLFLSATHLFHLFVRRHKTFLQPLFLLRSVCNYVSLFSPHHPTLLKLVKETHLKNYCLDWKREIQDNCPGTQWAQSEHPLSSLAVANLDNLTNLYGEWWQEVCSRFHRAKGSVGCL